MEACLTEVEFVCRSFNFDSTSGQCTLSAMDRHTLSVAGSTGTRNFRPADKPGIDYFESNCVREPNKLCDFKAIKGKVVKTVDSVYQGVATDDECRRKCLESQFRCFSYDLGDSNNKVSYTVSETIASLLGAAQPQVCRTSHLDSSSLTHISEAYFEAPGAVTYELASCFDGNCSMTP